MKRTKELFFLLLFRRRIVPTDRKRKTQGSAPHPGLRPTQASAGRQSQAAIEERKKAHTHTHVPARPPAAASCLPSRGAAGCRERDSSADVAKRRTRASAIRAAAPLREMAAKGDHNAIFFFRSPFFFPSLASRLCPCLCRLFRATAAHLPQPLYSRVKISIRGERGRLERQRNMSLLRLSRCAWRFPSPSPSLPLPVQAERATAH